MAVWGVRDYPPHGGTTGASVMNTRVYQAIRARSHQKKSRASAAGRNSPFHKVRRLELLEARRLLTVNWTGDGGDGLWNDPNNWSTMAVPTSTDDVVIGSAGSPTVTIDIDELANSISVAAGATLSLAQSG